jgi:CheY-like chemotaxis protein
VTPDSAATAGVVSRDGLCVAPSTCAPRRGPLSVAPAGALPACRRPRPGTVLAAEPLRAPSPRRPPAGSAESQAASGRRSASEPRPRVRAVKPSPILAGLTVLLVEDDPDALRITRIMLEHHGAQVLTATDGVDALWRLLDAHADVAIIDLRMPVMDGFALAARLHADPHWWDLPLVALTALGSDADFIRTLEQDFQAHLVKPVDDDVLASVVARAARTGRGRRPRA